MWSMESIRSELENLRDGSPVGSFEWQHEFGAEGARRVFCVWGRTMTVDGSRVLLVTMEDISVRINTERRLAQLNEELLGQVHSTQEWLGRTQSELRALAGSLFESQENERRRVARELHDDISQQLALLEMSLTELEQSGSSDPAELRRHTAGLRERTAKLSDDVRTMSHRLHPSALDHLGLPAALKALVQDFGEREAMPATFMRQNVPESIPAEVAGVLYRITQEALRNVAKHAGKTHVKVVLQGLESQLRLQVTDLGEGFDLDDARGGLGFISMAERARLVKADFKVESALGRGTTVTIDVPLSGPEGQRGES
jgi:two-component system CheB/CheR fusion protein